MPSMLLWTPCARLLQWLGENLPVSESASGSFTNIVLCSCCGLQLSRTELVFWLLYRVLLICKAPSSSGKNVVRILARKLRMTAVPCIFQILKSFHVQLQLVSVRSMHLITVHLYRRPCVIEKKKCHSIWPNNPICEKERKKRKRLQRNNRKRTHKAVTSFFTSSCLQSPGIVY